VGRDAHDPARHVVPGLTALTLALWGTDPNHVETNPMVDLAFFALGVCWSPEGSRARSPAGPVAVALGACSLLWPAETRAISGDWAAATVGLGRRVQRHRFR
jgi:hypothetical protein